MGTLQVGGTTLGVKNTSTNKVDLSNVGDINVSGDIKNSGLEYLSARWPLTNDQIGVGHSNLGTSDTSNILHQANVLSWTYSTGTDLSIFTITGITTGIWYFHATFGFDRTTYSTGDKTIRLRMLEDGTDIWEGFDTYETQHHTSQGFSIIRNYSSVPSSIKIDFYSDNNSYFRRLANCITIYRLG